MSNRSRWQPDPDELRKGLEHGQAKGAAEVEIYVQRSHSREAKVYQQKIESLESSETVGLGVRAIVDGKAGYAYTPDAKELLSIVAKAVENAEIGTSDEFNRLPTAAPAEPIEGIYSDKVEAVSMEEKIEIALQAEAAATSHDSRVRGYTTTYADDTEDVWITNSNGVMASYRVGYAYAYTSVVAEQNGEAQTAWAFGSGREPSQLSAEAIGVEAAERALALLGAKKIESCEASILLQPMVASQFLTVLSQALSADSVLKGRSLLADKVGETIASSLISVIDDGRRPDGLASTPVDDEGVPSGTSTLIEKGTLKGFLHNSYTALKSGGVSTGNASRGSFRSLPGVAPTNLYFDAGTTPPDELISSMKRGMIVHEVSGLHAGANAISGEISLGATGLWVENGKVVHPVREVTIGGHLLSMLKDVEGLGNDLRFVPVGGSTGAPSILISRMTIGGS